MKVYDEAKLVRMKEYIQAYQFGNGISPSHRKIMKHMGWEDLAMVHRYIKVLESRGYIKKTDLGAIEIPFKLTTGRLVAAPLVGTVPCGKPKIALEEIECSYALPVDLFGASDKFLLKAAGDSMIDAGIHSGDLLIVERREEAHNGQIVVVMVDGANENEATAKRYFREKDDRIRLHPENKEMEDIFYANNQVQVCGVVVGIIRSYK